jgi:hypothetical protein
LDADVWPPSPNVMVRDKSEVRRKLSGNAEIYDLHSTPSCYPTRGDGPANTTTLSRSREEMEKTFMFAI